jgi:hypothetical protein
VAEKQSVSSERDFMILRFLRVSFISNLLWFSFR